MAEEFTHLRKSKPVIIAAGVIWAAIAWVMVSRGEVHAAEHALRHNLLEYAELMLFLLVAMTYINAMEERRVFDALRAWLIRTGFGFRKLFWLTGLGGSLLSIGSAAGVALMGQARGKYTFFGHLKWTPCHRRRLCSQ